MPTSSDNDVTRDNARLRVHHLERTLEGFKTMLDKEHAEREKKAALVRRAELAVLLGVPAASSAISPRDFDLAVERGIAKALRTRDRNKWWRRLWRYLNAPRDGFGDFSSRNNPSW